MATAAACALVTWPAAAAAAPTITEFTTGLTANGQPRGITTGPDGNLWFTEGADPGRIGTITPAGAISEFTTGLAANGAPLGIAKGPDGNLWFAEEHSARLGRITPAGVISEFTHSGSPSSWAIVAGPDGNLWFTGPGANPFAQPPPHVSGIGRMTPTGLPDGTWNSDHAPLGMTAGPDGNLWFVEGGPPARIGRITPDAVITHFTTGLTSDSRPLGITAGPDGNLWFTESFAPGRIGRITPSGVITEFTTGLTPNSAPWEIAAAADGNLWFTELADPGRIGRITPDGVITEYTTGLTANSAPWGITAGPDGNVWFTESANPGRIGRITIGPGAATAEASGVTSAGATLNGSVRPNSQATTFQFQYGADTSYGSATPAQVAGDDATAHAVSAAIAGLSPGTTYHYRLVATNASDTTVGVDRTFTTGAAPNDPGTGDPSDPGTGDPNGPGTGTVASPPTAADLSRSPSSIRVNRKRRFRFSFVATPALTGKIAFRRIKKGTVLARKAFTVSADGRVKLRLRLSKKNFRLLKRKRRIRTRATVTLQNAAGLTSTARKRVTLKAPRRR